MNRFHNTQLIQTCKTTIQREKEQSYRKSQEAHTPSHERSTFSYLFVLFLQNSATERKKVVASHTMCMKHKDR